MMSAELALERTNDKALRELIERIRGSAQRMARMIEQLHELRHVLFEPFRRSDGRYCKKLGLGLGLYITEQLVLAHGGSGSFASSSEAGTCFLVSLPRHCRDWGHREEAPIAPSVAR